MTLKMSAILAILLTARIAYAQDIPVLPLPVHVEKGNPQTLIFSSPFTFHYIGLDNAATERLQTHWNHFAPSTLPSTLPSKPPSTLPSTRLLPPTNNRPATSSKLLAPAPAGLPAGKDLPPVIQIGLLGKDIRFDSLLAQPAAPWQNKIGKEGYLIIFRGNQRIIAAHTETGLFYALQTLKQLVRAQWKQELLIADYPSFARRAVYDDISRGPISTIAYIKSQIERLAELKINELSFYIEHVVQPLSYPDFAPDNGKLTIPQIRELAAYAAKYHIQLVGSFQSFGHFDKILALPQYRSMGETSTLISPLDPKAKGFLTSVISELCEAFPAPWFNVNCDETFDLEKGRSKAYIDSIGPARFYADHILFLHDIAKQHHKRLMIWGDIALKHEEILDMLPRDIIYLTWEYGSQSSFAPWITPFKKRGLDFMVCPGVLNSYRLMPDMAMAAANIDGFLREGYEKGASGVINTVWDDGSAYLFSGDWYGVYKGADRSWNTTAQSQSSFDARYSSTAYGSPDQSYVKAMHAMMMLRKLPLTYNLTDNIWTQKLLPDSGRQMILNNADTDSALRIIHRAKQFIDAARPILHATDIETLKLSIAQYQLIMDGRQAVIQIAGTYRQALACANSNPSRSTALISQAARMTGELKDRYSRLLKTFRTAWLRENQTYSLDIAATPFLEKIRDLQQLQQRLQSRLPSVPQSGTPSANAMCSPSSMQLDIIANDHFYFQNWLLSGPFPLDSTNNPPAFLYAGDAATDLPPKPGDLFTFRNTSYRWKKYASPNGGITALADFFPPGQHQVAYAFCTITSDLAITINSFTTGNRNIQVFCNGARAFPPGLRETYDGHDAPSTQMTILLPLKAGTNHILFKIPAGDPVEDPAWAFSFRLDPQLVVTNQKYKYFLTPEKGNHEAE